MLPVLIIGFIVLILIAFYVIRVYNKVKSTSVNVDQAFGSIEVALEERFDMLTKVISTANQESKREIEMQTDITALRAKMNKAGTLDERIEASNLVEQAMPAVLLTVENYPDPKFNKAFREVHRSIMSIEDKLSASRRNFNAHVAIYNKLIVTFPAVIIARMMNFTEKDMFEATAHKRDDVDMDALWQQ